MRWASPCWTTSARQRGSGCQARRVRVEQDSHLGSTMVRGSSTPRDYSGSTLGEPATQSAGRVPPVIATVGSSRDPSLLGTASHDIKAATSC
jgi:hypothetical protein